MPDSLAADAMTLLRQRIAAIEQIGPKLEAGGAAFVRSGHGGLDGVLGGFARSCVHEIFGEAATGFTLALAARLTRHHFVWIAQNFAHLEQGEPYAPGLAAFGLKPEQMLLITCEDTLGVLHASEEALKARVFDCVILEPWGTAKALDLTASRRLMLAAAQGQSTALMLRSGAHEAPSAAAARWHIRAAPSVSPFAVGSGSAGFPGFPRFDVELTRARNGRLGRWLMEWNNHERTFETPLSGAAFSSPADRPVAAAAPRKLG